MEDLFGEEEEEEEEVAMETKDESAEPVVSKTMGDLFGEEDEEEDEDGVEASAAKATTESRKAMGELFGEDEAEEGEEEGRSASEAAENKAEEAKARQTMKELFSDEEEDEEDEAVRSAKRRTRDLFGDEDDDDDDVAKRQAEDELFGEEERPKEEGDEEEEEPLESRDDTMRLPKLAAPRPGSRTVLFHVPKFLGLEHAPLPEQADEHFDRSSARAPPSVVRWRWKREVVSGDIERDTANNPIRESNARLVRWSNGSLQLVVGSDRFDVINRGCDRTYLFAQVKPEEGNMCMLAHAKYAADYRLMPPSLTSTTHKQFTSRVKSKSRDRGMRVREIFTKEDPVKAQEERIRLKEEQIRRDARRKQRAIGHRRPHADRDDAPRAAMNASFLEFEEDHNTTSLKAVKRQVRTAAHSNADDDDDEGGQHDDRGEDDDDDFIVDDDQEEEDLDAPKQDEDEDDQDDDDNVHRPRRTILEEDD